MQIEKYFKELENQVKAIYNVASRARKRGLDPKPYVEIPLATSLAERAIGLISIKYPQLKDEKVIQRIKELEKKYGKLDPAVCLTVAEEVAKEKFCKFRDLLEAIDAGIRLAFAYYTLGVVVPPLEGFTHFELKKTRDGKDYFCVYYSGPIRAAGTTASAFSLVIIDYLRNKFGFSKYDPTEIEIKREITEIYDYHERITNLQYLASEEELSFLLKHLPIQIDGLPSEDKEVSNYKDLPRIETNQLRNGMCLVLSEGLAQKAEKLLRFIKKLKIQGFELPDWDFLEEFIKLKKKVRDVHESAETAEAYYIKDLVAGRPVFSHPSRSGGFRLRYGRARTSGFSAMAIHPATMAITDNFIAIGTQIKTERPTKGAALGICDSIDGPIVKLNDGSVVAISDFDESRELYREIREILYLGDLLVPYADFLNRNALLEPAGYVEEYWLAELKEKIRENGEETINEKNVGFEEALELSKKYGIGLHPKYIFFWSQISKEQFLGMLDWLGNGRIDKKLILPYSKTDKERFVKGKRALELLGLEHKVTVENVVISSEPSKAFFVNLGLDPNLIDKKDYLIDKHIEKITRKIKYELNKLNGEKEILDIINLLSDFEIRDKAGTFIGARMGRPEKAKLRKLTGSPNVLFPVGSEGGRLRSIQAACEVGSVKADFPLYFCEKCNKETIYSLCEECETECIKRSYCPKCYQVFPYEKCPEHGIGQKFSTRKINLPYYFDSAVKKLGLHKEELPVLIKGVRGTSSRDHTHEHLAKGFLRSLFNLNVNKDGTIRYDATELPLTHFKPKEVSTSIEKLKELGYTKDVYGKPLESDEQLLEIYPHDVLLPACPDSLEEPADQVFMNIANFVDNLLERFYGLKSFYNIKRREDLIGHLVVCMAPHNAAGVIGRIIGFSKVQAMLASPYMHAGMRRDADGDEAAFILLLDCLINFSREYLPDHRGATQDAPLVLNMKLTPGEVDDQIFDFDVMKELPIELYRAAEKKQPPSIVAEKIELLRDRIINPQPGKSAFKGLWCSHAVSDINNAVLCSSYKSIPTMQEKVQRQMSLVEKIRAADTGDTARLIIDRHFMRDIKGNLRKFSTQGFRCVMCNEKFRRPPLQGNCPKCKGKIIFTVSEGGIIKYLTPALSLANNYDVPDYVKQNLELTKRYIESIFGREETRQTELGKWF